MVESFKSIGFPMEHKNIHFQKVLGIDTATKEKDMCIHSGFSDKLYSFLKKVVCYSLYMNWMNSTPIFLLDRFQPTCREW